MKELITVLENTIDKIEGISLKLYQDKEQEGYSEFVTSIGEISNIVTAIFQMKDSNSELLFNEALFLEKLTLSVKALEDNDTVLLADILYYEVSTQLRDFSAYIRSQSEH